MVNILDRIPPSMLKYIAVGVSVYLFEVVVIMTAIRFGASNIWAVGISFWSGLIVSFFLQKIFTFSDTRMHHRVLLPQFLAVTALVLFNFGFTLLVTKLLQSIAPAVVSRTIALGITTLWNFYLYKTRIFTNQE